MTITGLSGDIGSGKSWKMLQYALEQSNFKQKYLVTNFGLNLPNLKRYCAAKKQWWNIHMIDSGWFAVVSLIVNDGNKENLSLTPLFKHRENSIVCLDEAGIFLNSRNYKNTPAQLLMDLAQSRKSGNDLIWAAQFDTQVDVQFRNLTQFWIHCDAFTAYNKKMRRPELKWKTYYHFKGAEYQRWQLSTKARTSFIRTYFSYSFKTEFGPLSVVDRMLFTAFDSFTRLENQAAAAKEMKLPSYRTQEELEKSDYYPRAAVDRCRVLVRRGVMRQKTDIEKKYKIIKTEAESKSFDWASELGMPDAEESKAVATQIATELPKPIIYIAPIQDKPKLSLKLSYSFAFSFILFFLLTTISFSLYNLIDAQISPPRGVPLAGPAGNIAR